MKRSSQYCGGDHAGILDAVVFALEWIEVIERLRKSENEKRQID